ncbi:putative ubiquitin-conjugating enzyme protein 17 [Toxocara canis]|uniref:Putative ubiquitin-conjugating enzyme protein 17 n=1 Tax=Toxocara canis TaxID=6265 RepID=A0A0B2V0A3_TOXCA|nr:putative ubiquitin-conjugating enzyme protein 17 [Toxocara canis]
MQRNDTAAVFQYGKGHCRLTAFVCGSKQAVRHTGRLLTRTVMGTAVSSTSSPEPDDTATNAERLLAFLDQKPLRMTNMLKLTRIINDSTSEEKLQLFRAGVLRRLCQMIADCGSVHAAHRVDSGNDAEKRRRQPRRNSSIFTTHKGVGYGHGSTRSRWDIERAVEERLAREEHLIWLLNAVTAYIYCASPDFSDDDYLHFMERSPVHVGPPVVKEIGESAIIALLEYHLNNDSVFDVSEHMELYQALLETAAAMSVVPALVPYLVRPQHRESKSIAKDLVLRFSSTMSSYPNVFKGQMGSPDFRLIDFITKTERYSEVLISAARRYERDLPAEQRVRTAVTRPRTTHSEASLSRHSLGELSDLRIEEHADIGLLYGRALKHLQMQTFKFIGDYGKLVVPFSFKKEVRNVNPFSPSLKERTKRIAKELASMPNTLPLNASNSIFVCVDEGRCDIVKVLISGPDDTPYQNGLFEFDVFFPTSYPFSPPKCAFLTTGAGNVRFNPNLYNDGKICLSILGTWEGRPEEKWNPYCSLLQVLISIQGLIFVKEPYFNEPGFEKYQGTEKGEDYSRKYNLQIEHATLTYAIRDQLKNGPEYFRKVIQRHFWLKRHTVIEQAHKWLAEMRRDLAEAEKNPKRKDSLSFDTIYNPIAQERAIQQLIDELGSMTCPCDHCKSIFVNHTVHLVKHCCSDPCNFKLHENQQLLLSTSSTPYV